MSNRLFQGIIYQYKDIVGKTIGVIDENGVVVACSDLMKIGETKQSIREELNYVSDVVVSDGYTYKQVTQGNNSDYIVFVEGDTDDSKLIASMIAVSLTNIKNTHNDKFDKLSFIKNILLDNIFPGDIYLRGRELNFETNVTRVVFLLKFYSQSENSPYDIIQNIVTNTNQDFVISVGEKDIVLVKELGQEETIENLESFARGIVDSLATEFYTKVLIGIGSQVSELKDISKSYREAQAALEVRNIFDSEKSVVCYENLGIGRLIYQLPTTLCEMFLNEVFKDCTIDDFDNETKSTINSFFENSLNVSETSRKMFVHRNTLVYRLDKIKKITGLDLREFDNAITFKVAMMVNSYLKSKEKNR